MSEDNATEFGAKFIRNYSMLLSAVWQDEVELNRLLANPTQYAIDRQLPVAPGATVRVDRSPRESLLHKNEVVESWTATPGTHVLHVPENVPEDIELTDAELDSVAAGSNNIIVILIIV